MMPEYCFAFCGGRSVGSVSFFLNREFHSKRVNSSRVASPIEDFLRFSHVFHASDLRGRQEQDKRSLWYWEEDLAFAPISTGPALSRRIPSLVDRLDVQTWRGHQTTLRHALHTLKLREGFRIRDLG